MAQLCRPDQFQARAGNKTSAMTNRRITRRIAIVTAITMLAAACVYRLDTEQGNYLEPAVVDQIAVGDDRNSVLYRLGTPVIADPFHEGRWDYVYYFRSGNGKRTETHRVTVYFTDNKVSRIERIGI